MDSLEAQLLDQVDQIFCESGLFQQHYNSTYNANQHDYARQAAMGFCRYREVDQSAGINMLQASTGLGKTMAYLVPASLHSMLTGSRVIVSTYTKHLQHQILSKDAMVVADLVSKLTGKTPKIMRRVGRQNYLSRIGCVDFLAHLEEQDDQSSPALLFMRDLCVWLEKQPDNALLLDDFINGVDGDALMMPASIDRKLITINAQSPQEEIELYKTDISRTYQADVLITNHALTVLNAYRWASILDGDRKSDILICDEADRLQDAAETMMTSDVPLHVFSGMCSHFSEAFASPEVEKVARNLEALVKGIQDEGQDVAIMSPVVKIEVKNALKQLLPVAKKCVKAMTEESMNDKVDERSLMAEFVDAVADLQEVANAADDKTNTCLVSWSPIRAYPSLRIGKPKPARILGRLYSPRNWDGEDDQLSAPRSYLRSCLFTSATLGTPGKALPMAFDHLANAIGVIRHCREGYDYPVHHACVDLYRVYEPKQFGLMRFVVADPSIENPTLKVLDYEGDTIAQTSEAWLDYCATMIREAAKQQDRTLVLTLSFNDTYALAERLKDLDNLICHRRGQALSSYLAEYKKYSNAVLITPSGWEGVDLPGMVQNLVVTRIPYSKPDSYQSKIEEIFMRQNGYSPEKIERSLYGLSIEQTKRKLAQGFGRGIRKFDDTVTVWIADPRMPFAKAFTQSLDPVLMEADTQRQNKLLLPCVPQRFAQAYSEAKIFMKNGELYQPEVI